jgi:hypothetical protein
MSGRVTIQDMCFTALTDSLFLFVGPGSALPRPERRSTAPSLSLVQALAQLLARFEEGNRLLGDLDGRARRW